MLLHFKWFISWPLNTGAFPSNVSGFCILHLNPGRFHCPIQYCSVDFHLVGTCLQTTPTSPDNEKHSGVSFSPNKFEDIKVMWLHEWLSFSSRAEYSLSFTTRPDYKCSRPATRPSEPETKGDIYQDRRCA